MSGTFLESGGGLLDATGLADRWSDLGNFTDSLRNVLARPGTFADLFPETNDDGLISLLRDGLAECHLEQLLSGYESDDNGLVRPVLTSGQLALVVLYAGIRLIRAELLNRITSSKFVAGPVSAETTYATNVLRDVMKVLEVQKKDITAKLTTIGAGTSFWMQDSYVANAFRFPPNGVSLAEWLPLQPAWMPFY